MKEILFRGKSIVADSPNTPGHWLEGCYISRLMEYDDALVNEIHIIERNHYINIYLDSDTEVWPETVGQYTGLKDCDGRKIFEGDIVEIDEHDTWINGLYQVIYAEKNHCYALERGIEHHYSYFSFSDLNGFNETCKVLGNIYDNPELLEVE